MDDRRIRSDFIRSVSVGVDLGGVSDAAKADLRAQGVDLDALNLRLGNGDSWIEDEAESLYQALFSPGYAAAGPRADPERALEILRLVTTALQGQRAERGFEPGWEQPPPLTIGGAGAVDDRPPPHEGLGGTRELFLRPAADELDRRPPWPEDQQRLFELDVIEQALLDERRTFVQTAYEEQVAPSARIVAEARAGRRPDVSGPELAQLEGYIAFREAKIEDDLARLDRAIMDIRAERDNYLRAMELAGPRERVVWLTSRIGHGWVPERYAAMQRNVENSPGYQYGFAKGEQYAALREQGYTPGQAAFRMAGVVAGDFTGVNNLYEAAAGHQVITGNPISTGERVVKGLLGTVSAATLIAGGGPRVRAFADRFRGAQFAMVQTAPPMSARFPLLVVAGNGQIPLALTQAEATTLVANGILQMRGSSPGDGTPPQPVPGLRNAHYGPLRGGGGREADRAYHRKVTGRDDAVYVDDIELDGYDVDRGVLLDAKNASGPGSWYDLSKDTDGFTRKFKMASVLEQANRQRLAMQISGARGIEWHVADQGVANTLRKFLQENGFDIVVRYTAP